VRLHRTRAARHSNGAHFLAQRAAQDLVERLAAVNRTFERVLVIGGAGAFNEALAANPDAAAKLGSVFAMDLATGWAARGVAADPERLPFRQGSLDLVVSLLSLHWTNDLPGALVQIRRALIPDGLFLGAMFGGATLTELRSVLLEAELAQSNGASARVAPFADARDLGGLLQRAGFALPVCDSDIAQVRYRSPERIVQDLRAMGETAALSDRPRPLTRTVWAHAMALYAERFGAGEGRVRATFEILTMTGWSPHDSQQKPLQPGSAKMRLADALGVKETKLQD
jgi:SAM-dependent methyltransferase